MPREIITRRVLSEVKLEAIVIDFSNAAPGTPPLVTVNYQVIDSNGNTFEAKRVGGKVVPASIRPALRQWWDQLQSDILTEEGI